MIDSYEAGYGTPTRRKKREDAAGGKPLEDLKEGGERDRYGLGVGALLKDTRRLNCESKVRKVERNSGMIILPGAWVGRRVKISVELLD